MNSSGLGKKFLLLAVSSLVSLLIAEIVVRIVMPQDLITNTSWYQANPIYRFRHRENMDRRMRWGTYYHLKTNFRGLREDRDIPYDAVGKWRVVIHGDSFTFGNGVEREFIFPVVAQAYLWDKGIANAEVINLGVSAHGPSLEYLYFQEEGKKYHPQVVAIAAFPANDVADEVRDRAFIIQDGKLIFQPYQIPLTKRLTDNFLYQALINHSHLLVALRLRFFSGNPPGLEKVYSKEEDFAKNITAAVAVWQAFAQEIKAFGAVPVILILPTREQIYARQGRPLPTDPYPIAEPARRALAQMCVEQNLHCLDLLPVMADKLKNPDAAFIKALEGHIDFHYNALGHRMVGVELGKLLWNMARENPPAPRDENK